MVWHPFSWPSGLGCVALLLDGFDGPTTEGSFCQSAYQTGASQLFEVDSSAFILGKEGWILLMI
jgi:hypothetical protein